MTVLGKELDRNGTACLRAQLAGLLDGGTLAVRLDLNAVRHHDEHLSDVLAWVESRFRARGGHLITTGAAVDPLCQPPAQRHPKARTATKAAALFVAGHSARPASGSRPETADQP